MKQHVRPGTRLVKLDLKDFYLSGSSYVIAEKLAKLVSPDVRGFFYSVLFFLLFNQYISSSSLGTTYRCVAGSGIGLSHSAIVTNVLFSLVSEEFVIPSQPGLQLWVRYHDDCIAIMNRRCHAKNLVDALRARTFPIFTIVCEGVHSVGCNFEFLDFEVTLTPPLVQIQALQKNKYPVVLLV